MEIILLLLLLLLYCILMNEIKIKKKKDLFNKHLQEGFGRFWQVW